MRTWIICFCALALLSGLPATGQDENTPLELHLETIKTGNLLTNYGDEPEKFAATPMVQAARRLGVDPGDPAHPFLVHQCRDGRCFYLFYNTVFNVPDQAYLIQRVKKTDTVVDAVGKTSVTTNHLVEVFKSADGKLPGADQHFGYFSLRGAKRRTITKEYEIGMGSVPEHAAPGAWPFKGLLYKCLQNYQLEPDLYDQVKLKQVKRWSMILSFDAKGNYELRVPELDVDVLVRVPGAAGPPAPPEAGKETVLREGRGVKGLTVGLSTAADVRRVLGKPKKITAHANAKNYWYDGFFCNVNGLGTLNTIFSDAGFSGKTSKGIRLGDNVAVLKKVYGKPSAEGASTITFSQHGILFHLNADGEVRKIVVIEPLP